MHYSVAVLQVTSVFGLNLGKCCSLTTDTEQDLQYNKVCSTALERCKMKLNATMMQWLSTPVKDDADFLDFCNRDFMQLCKESDYCFTIYFDPAYKTQAHNVLNTALDKFQLEAAE